MILAIIPARIGSKRLPKKNIKPLAGKPLINYAIGAAKQSKKIYHTIVSSDSPEICELAINQCVEAPFLRPAELSTDSATSEDVMRHALLFMENLHKIQYEFCVLLQPTSPLTSAQMIDQCIEHAQINNFDSVITVCNNNKRCEWIGTIENNNFKYLIKLDDRKEFAKKEQFVPSGNVYVIKRNVLITQSKIITNNTGIIKINQDEAIDIDTISDFNFAEFIIKNKEQK